MKIHLINRADTLLFYNGKLLDIKSNGNSEYAEIPHSNGGEKTSLHIIRRSELSQKGWFFYSLFFWIIGFFGFFTPRYEKNPNYLDCIISFYNYGEEEFKIRFNNYLPSKNFVNVNPVEVIGKPDCITENFVYQLDKTAKRRRKIYKLLSFLLRIAAIILILVLLIN